MVDVSPIPPNYKLPGTSITVDPSQAGTQTALKYALIVGHPTSAGTMPKDIPTAVGTIADARVFTGAGSMLMGQIGKHLGINQSTPLFVLAVAEPASGVAATGTVTVSSAPTVAGTIPLYIAGKLVSVAVSSTDTTAQVATKIAAAITASTLDIPVTASATASAVTLTCRWKGLTGNEIRVEDSYRGFYGGEFLPAGLALTYPTNNTLSGGTGVPDLTQAIANIGDDPFYFVGQPFTDSGSLAAFGTEFGFSDSGRWGWMRQSYGLVFSSRKDTYANQVTWGPSNNYPVISVMDDEPESPSPSWEQGAAYMAQAALELTADPARPLQTLPLDGILPAPRGKRRNKLQLNTLAMAGLAIQGTDVYGPTGGVPIILREQTTYQRNTLGQPDNAYELVTTLSTLAEVFTRVRQAMTNKYPRHKLANDGTRYGAGQAIVTPKTIKGEIVALLRQMEFDGLVENVDISKTFLVVERSTKDSNTVEVLFPPDLINGLRRLNIKAQFRLQFPAALAA